MYKYRKLLSDNHIKEDDQDLPQTIIRQIQKFKKIEASAKDDDSQEMIDQREAELDAMDGQIMKTLPDYFDMEDEEEQQRIAAEKERKQKEIDKAKLAEKTKAAKEKADKEKAEKELADKAKADKEKADQEAAAKAKAAAEAEELAKPATTNHGALEKLFKQGKTTVSSQDLKKAGFNTSFTGPIGFNGCKIKEFELYRDDQYSETFELSKK
jgi:hypothetical protein